MGVGACLNIGMTLAKRILSLLTEMPWPSSTSKQVPAPQTAAVDYYVVTPRGSYSRFRRVIALSNIRGRAHSETAVRSYLMRFHPGTEINIVSIEMQ